MHPSTWVAIKGPNGDLTWRVESPAHVVGAKVIYIDDETGAEKIGWPNDDSTFPWSFVGKFDDGSPAEIHTREQWAKATREHGQLVDYRSEYHAVEGDSVVVTRPLSWLAAHMLELRGQGKRVLAEVDDNYLSPARANIFMSRAGWSERDRDDHMRSICVGDGLIVSTDLLRDLYWKGLRQWFPKKYLPEIFVCRNHVDERFTPKEVIPSRSDGRLRVGYMGSDSHIWDVDLIYDALSYAFSLGHEIVFIGVHPQAINPKYKRSKHDWSQIEYTHIRWSNTFRGTALPLDIGFAPLIVNDHTLGKSDIKWLEYALSGAACVAHNCAVYGRTAKHGETALLAGSPGEYVSQLKLLLKDANLRNALVGNTMQYIREERLLENNKQEWRDAVYG